MEMEILNDGGVNKQVMQMPKPQSDQKRMWSIMKSHAHWSYIVF